MQLPPEGPPQQGAHQQPPPQKPPQQTSGLRTDIPRQGPTVDTVRHMVVEMKWKPRLLAAGGGLTVAKFKDEAIHYAGLLVLAFLCPK